MKITQNEARRLRREVKELKESRRLLTNGWLAQWPDGVHLLAMDKTDTVAEEDIAIVRTARKLGHPVVVTENDGSLHFYGVK